MNKQNRRFEHEMCEFLTNVQFSDPYSITLTHPKVCHISDGPDWITPGDYRNNLRAFVNRIKWK